MHHRRGAALWRQAQGDLQGDAQQRRRADPLGHPDSAHFKYGDVRHPGYVHHRGGPAGPPAGADLCHGARLGRSDPGDEQGAAPRRAGVLPAQPGGHHRQLRGHHPEAHPRRDGGGRPRQDERGAALQGLEAAARPRDRHPGLHHHHRDRRGRLQLQHPDYRGGGPAGPLPALPDPRTARATFWARSSTATWRRWATRCT